MIHIYTETRQPATRFTDHHCNPPLLFTYPERRLRWCDSCGRRRWMGKLSVQVYFDGARMTCTDRDECRRAWKRGRGKK